MVFYKTKEFLVNIYTSKLSFYMSEFLENFARTFEKMKNSKFENFPKHRTNLGILEVAEEAIRRVGYFPL